MFVDAQDNRPPSLLQKRPSDYIGMGVGILLAAGIHFALPLVIVLALAVLHAVGLLVPDGERRPVVERQVVEARFAKLGRPFDPRQLPNRRVNVLDTQVSHDTAVSKVQHARRDVPDAGPRRTAREERINSLGTRAQLFAELAQQQLQEGNPEGIEEGTEQNARLGDVYAGQLYAFFRRGWSTPTTIDPDELRGLTCEIDVTISGDGHIDSVRVRHSSGNALFDQSVLDRMQEIQTNNVALPAPPQEIAQDYLGQTIGLRFRGRDAR